MCRWFAYMSPEEPCLLSDVLINPANAISKQCSEHYLPKLLPHGDETDLHDTPDRLVKMRNSLLNMDGLGVAWYTNAAADYQNNIDGRRPALYKSQSPPINDFNFRSLCENTQSHCVLAHIRASSGSVVSQVNCHPFIFGRHVFMHNGVVSNFTEIRRPLLHQLCYDAFENILGSTDSEHAAALYMTFLTNGGTKETWQKQYPLQEMHAAMVKTVITLMELQQTHLGASQTTPNSLNFCATDGHRMVAIRFRNHATEQPPSLYWSEFAGRNLNRKYPGHPDSPDLVNVFAIKGEDEKIGRHTIVASEPTTHDENEWHLIGKNCALTVDEFGTETEIPIEYDVKFNVNDPSAA
jgi:glutamine amidotransferase